MLRRVILGKVASAERELGSNLDYVREIVRTSLRAFLRFTKLLAVAEYRRTLPIDVSAVARLVATHDADCGTCLQLEVDRARKAGVGASVVRAVLDDRPDDLPASLAEVHRFATAVVRSTGAEDALRERIRERYGAEALVELALAMAACRTFPIVKRTLGYATPCARVAIRGS
jgi:alkylhydroperoxidase family enzyme